MVKLRSNLVLDQSIRDLILEKYIALNGDISYKELGSYFCNPTTVCKILSNIFAK